MKLINFTLNIFVIMSLIRNLFINACSNGKLCIAKSLLKNNPDINISANINYAFLLACSLGQLEISQWLLTINRNIDISANNEYIFRQPINIQNLEISLLNYIGDIIDLYGNDYSFTIELKQVINMEDKYIYERNNNNILR